MADKSIVKVGNALIDHDTFDEYMRQAETIVKSDLVPFKKAEDLVIVMQAAKEYGIPISSALANMYVIKGRVSVGVHVLMSLVRRGGVTTKVIHDAEPVKHFVTRGKTPVIITAKDFVKNFDNYMLIKPEQWSDDMTIPPNKIPIIAVNPPYIDEKKEDRVTTIEFQRKVQYADGSWAHLVEEFEFYLHQAYQANFMGASISNPKDNWYNHTTSMLYARCAAFGAKRFAPDLIHGIAEVSELGDVFDVDYTVEEGVEGSDPQITVKRD